MSSDSGCGGLIALGLLGIAVYSCSNSAQQPSSVTDSRYSAGSYADTGSDEAEEEREPFDEDAAREAAEEELAASTYEDEGASYGCTDDCSGHDAGWRWRAKHGEQGYNPDSPSFEEGGRAFDDAVDEKVEEAREAYESGEDE